MTLPRGATYGGGGPHLGGGSLIRDLVAHLPEAKIPRYGIWEI